MNIYNYILQNPDKLVYLVYSLGWSLDEGISETDIIAFISNEEKETILINSGVILNHIYERHIKSFSYDNTELFLLNTNLNEITKMGNSIWQSAFVSTDIDKMSGLSFGNNYFELKLF